MLGLAGLGPVSTGALSYYAGPRAGGLRPSEADWVLCGSRYRKELASSKPFPLAEA